MHFECIIAHAVVRTFKHRGTPPHVYFWRTATGSEVGLVVEVNGRLIPIEVKPSSTPGASCCR